MFEFLKMPFSSEKESTPKELEKTVRPLDQASQEKIDLAISVILSHVSDSDSDNDGYEDVFRQIESLLLNRKELKNPDVIVRTRAKEENLVGGVYDILNPLSDEELEALNSQLRRKTFKK
jgi:hypothetical protein